MSKLGHIAARHVEGGGWLINGPRDNTVSHLFAQYAVQGSSVNEKVASIKVTREGWHFPWTQAPSSGKVPRRLGPHTVVKGR